MDSADFGSKEAGAKGGEARAKALTTEEKKAIARKGAEARWHVDVPEASHEGEFSLGNVTVSAAVLPNGKRLLTQATFLRALGRARSPKAGTGVLSTVDGMPFFLQADVLQPYVDDELRAATTPFFYREKSGKRGVGYDAELLPAVAEVYLSFRDAMAAQGKDVPQQYRHIVKACDIVMRGLARVGIVALVDEATGYQRDRARDELAKILEAFVAKELQKWIRTFPYEFYELMCDLRGLPMERAKKRPQYFGHLTNDIVYSRLAPGVLRELRARNPIDDRGRRKHKLFQFLTPDMGHPRLKEHLAGVISVMKAAKSLGLKWAEFTKLLNKTHPPHVDMPLFDNDENGDA